MCGGDDRVVDIVTTDSDMHAMDLLFLWAEGGNEAAIGVFEAAWNCQRNNEVNGVGAAGHAGADTLGSRPKLLA